MGELQCMVRGSEQARETLAKIVGMPVPHGGDLRIRWDRNVPAEVEHARRSFTELRGKGYLAYRSGSGDARGEQINEFDPAAERIVLALPMRGGL